MSLHELHRPQEPEADAAGSSDDLPPLPEAFQQDGVIIDASIFDTPTFMGPYKRRKRQAKTEDFLAYADRMVGSIGIVVTPASADFPKRLTGNDGLRRHIDTIKVARQMPSKSALRNLYAAAMKDDVMKVSEPKPKRTVVVADYRHMKALEGLTDYLIPVVNSGMIGTIASQGYFGYAERGEFDDIKAHLERFIKRGSPIYQLDSNEASDGPKLHSVE